MVRFVIVLVTAAVLKTKTPKEEAFVLVRPPEVSPGTGTVRVWPLPTIVQPGPLVRAAVVIVTTLLTVKLALMLIVSPLVAWVVALVNEL